MNAESRGVFSLPGSKPTPDIRVNPDRFLKVGKCCVMKSFVLQPFVAGRPDLEDVRLVTIWLEDKQEELVLLTNNFELAACHHRRHFQGALAN